MEADMRKVTVRVHEPLNLDQCQKVLATVLGKAGCPNCYSGFHLSFENTVNPAELILNVERGSQKVLEAKGI
jgi:hypothetical protein